MNTSSQTRTLIKGTINRTAELVHRGVFEVRVARFISQQAMLRPDTAHNIVGRRIAADSRIVWPLLIRGRRIPGDLASLEPGCQTCIGSVRC